MKGFDTSCGLDASTLEGQPEVGLVVTGREKTAFAPSLPQNGVAAHSFCCLLLWPVAGARSQEGRTTQSFR